MGRTNPSTMSKMISTYIWPWEAQPATMSERLCTYIWPWEEPILPPCQKCYALTSDHERNQSYNHVRRALRFITSPWKEPRYEENQASPWSTQTSLSLMAWSTNQLSIFRSQHTIDSLLLSAPYPWYSDIWYRYASTCHRTLGSPKTSHNPSCRNIYK